MALRSASCAANPSRCWLTCLSAQTHSRDALAALLWPDYSQNKSRTSLRQVLTDIRQNLGRDFLELEHEDVTINPGCMGQVDVLEFRA
ncbi:MAG: hypothetical protein U0521_22655 [Anaerolineae bacterium]